MEQFGHYLLQELLGRGGMGEVYRAFDTSKNDRVVALKRLPPVDTGNEEFRRRFLREAELAASLDSSRHVIPIHDYGEFDGSPYLVMRLVEGVDLGRYLRRVGSFAPPRAVHLLGQVAHALDAAHRSSLVHRDVKPANVLLDAPATAPGGDADFVYLIDFGIAANVLTNRPISTPGAGTLAYMAPERFRRSEDDLRVDVYSLGCLFYEMLTGAPPFTGTESQVMYAHVNSAPPSVRLRLPRLAGEYDEVIGKALEKQPSERYESAGALALAAQELVAADGSPQRFAATRTARPVRRLRPTLLLPPSAASSQDPSRSTPRPARQTPERDRVRARLGDLASWLGKAVESGVQQWESVKARVDPGVAPARDDTSHKLFMEAHKLLREDQRAAAVGAFERLAETGDGDYPVQAMNALGTYYRYRASRYEQAKYWFDRAISVEHPYYSSNARRHRASIAWIHDKDYTTAMALYEQVIATSGIAREELRAKRDIGRMLMSKGDTRKAIAWYEHVASSSDRSLAADAAFALGEHYASKRRRRDDARRWLREAMKSDVPRVRLEAGSLLRSLGGG